METLWLQAVLLCILLIQTGDFADGRSSATKIVNNKPMLMNSIPNRIVIYTKDVSNITGLSGKAARKLLRLIRMENSKSRGSFITVEEFAAYTGIKEEAIRPFLI